MHLQLSLLLLELPVGQETKSPRGAEPDLSQGPQGDARWGLSTFIYLFIKTLQIKTLSPGL